MRMLPLMLAFVACGKHADAPEKPDPVVLVTTVPVRRGDVIDSLTAYGAIVPAPGAAVTVTRPFEIKVAQLLVTPGQRVAAGDPLIKFEPSPETRLRVDVARKASDAAARNLENVKRRSELGLATNTDLLAAQQAVEQAAAEVKSLGNRGAGNGGTIDAPKAGVVAVVHVQEGALVPAGQALVSVVAEGSLEAELGVELARSAQVHVGDGVKIVPVSRREAVVDGKVRSVTRSVNPTTRMIPVMVSLQGDLLLGEYVEATFPIAKHEGLLVPRSAVLPESDQHVLFTVDQGHAKRHVVKVGAETRDEVELIAADVHVGDRVITVGNYGCADGALVREAAR